MLLAGLGPATLAADFNGDGTNDVGIFRPSAGVWSIQNVTRAYLGTMGDEPVPGDYNCDGAAEIAVFRPSSGLWSVQGVTRTYLGSDGDKPLGGFGGGGGFWSRFLDTIYLPPDEYLLALEHKPLMIYDGVRSWKHHQQLRLISPA